MRQVLLLAAALASSACGPRDMEPPNPPSQILDFPLLYARNCSGCHGDSGKGGAAIGLANPVYLDIADDATISRITSAGFPGTAMPAFAQKSGGTLTSEQIDAIVLGIRSHWAKPDLLRGAMAPPYAGNESGDAHRGAAVYTTFCSSCHGADGRGGERAGSIVDPAYLALVSDQSLRTTIIAGRPDLGSPDWRGDVPGTPIAAQDISDVVAWLAAQRNPFSALKIPGEVR